MNDIRLGPIVLSGPRFGVAIALVALLVTAELVNRRGRQGVSNVAWNAVLVGLVGARLGYVALHLSSYLRDPVSVLYLWQGGFQLAIGAGAALLYAVAAARKQPRVLAGALLAGVAGAVVWGGWQLAAGPAPAPSPNVLTAQLQGLEGGSYDVQAFVGRPLVVNLWATWCAPCQRELPMLEAAEADAPGVTFLFVSQGEPQARVARFLQAHHLKLQHVFLDAGSSLSAAVATKGLPTTLFFDSNGHLVSRWLGELSRPRLDDELARIR